MMEGGMVDRKATLEGYLSFGSAGSQALEILAFGGFVTGHDFTVR
jgi:hypothetical protein